MQLLRLFVLFIYTYFHRYIQIRYEDLVEDVQKIARKLYKFAEIPFDESVAKLIRKLTNGASNIKISGVERPPSFDHNHWKTEMELSMIRKIENSCRYIMKQLNYAKFE